LDIGILLRLAGSVFENDLLEQPGRFFLLVEQGRGIQKFELYEGPSERQFTGRPA